jgi:hypothetical protein
MRRLRLIPVALAASLTTAGCLTEETKCPDGLERMRGLCVEVRSDDDGGGLDSGNEGDVEPSGDADLRDGEPDAATEASAPPPAPVCYLDFDHDGAGAGAEVDCKNPYAALPDAGASPATDDAGAQDAATSDAGLPDAANSDSAVLDAAVAPDAAADAALPDGAAPQPPALPAVVNRNDDCDDHNPKRAPTLKELCDGIDNNCNNEVDDNAKNACGGTCTRVLDHAPGEACENALQGTCARAGKYICQGDTDVVCNAPQIAPSSELCGDSIDNDCDGATDEPDAVNAPFWYQDCDGDGYAAGTTGSVQSCAKPANAGSCGWTQVVPQPTTRTNWDCNDGSDAYKPGASYSTPSEGRTSWDFNCDGVLTPDPAPVQGPGFEICPDTIITALNSNRRECSPTNDARWNGCYFWLASTGIFTNEPPTRCPDNGTRKLDVREGVVDPWGFNLSAPRHATTCRSTARPIPNARTRSLRSASSATSPGAWICTVLTAAPVWPCR